MSELVERLKEYYRAAQNRDIEWHELHPNNMPRNPLEGVYSYFWFRNGEKWEFWKFTIEYMSRCDADGLSHPEEGVKYYVLHELCGEYDTQLKIPELSDSGFWGEPNEGEFSPDIVNSYGRFRYVFDDEETAKAVVSSELLHKIYPYTFIMSDEEGEEWNSFLDTFGKE